MNNNEYEKSIKFSFIMIVLNGMPFIEFSLNSIYKFAHEIIIVEGAVEKCYFAANEDGSSKDGTVDFIRSYNDYENKIKFIQGKWPEKMEMQNAAIEYVTGDYVWLIDSDEVYRKEDLERVNELLLKNNTITQINLIPFNFWKGFNYIFDSKKFYEPSHQYRRIFKFKKGSRFVSHRPPTLMWPNSDISTEEMNVLDGRVAKNNGIFMFHYSYVFPFQVYQKVKLYKEYGWNKAWNIDLEDWFKNFFLKWTPENRKELEKKYPVWTGDNNSCTVDFNLNHPEILSEFISEYNEKREKEKSVIGSADVQKLVIKAWDMIELDEPLRARKKIILNNLANNKFFWNIHVALAYSANKINPLNYLEIGTRTGGSLIQVLNNSDVKEIVCVDLWSGEYANYLNSKSHVQTQINEYKKSSGKEFSIELLQGDSHIILNEIIKWGKKFELITVDGDHSAEGALRDLTAAEKLLSEKGVIIFDDILNPGCNWLLDVAYMFKEYYSYFEMIVNYEDDNGTVIFLKNISYDEFINDNKSVRKKRIKIAGEDEKDKDLTQIDKTSTFAQEIEKIIYTFRPNKIIETGTYLGTGTTSVIANSIKKFGIENAKFYSIEVNPKHFIIAQHNLKQQGILDEVKCLWGLSLPRHMLPSIEEIEEKCVNNIEFDDIFVDHKERDRAKLYFEETNFSEAEDDLLGKYLEYFNFEPDFVLLDSGGHIGNLEFNYLIRKIQKPCIIALDDINHIKHRKSFEQIKNDSRFDILVHSDEKFGFCIARFIPEKSLKINKNAENILWVRTDSIGDNILAASMLKPLKENLPNAKIDVICQNHIVELYKDCPYVNDVIGFDKKMSYSNENYRNELISKIKKVNYDISFNTVFSSEPISDILILNSNSRHKIRVKGNIENSSEDWENQIKGLYDEEIHLNMKNTLELNRHKEFCEKLNLSFTNLEPQIWLNENDEKFANELFDKYNLLPEKTIVLFAGTQFSNRSYFYYGKALNRFCKKHNFSVIAVGSNEDKQITEINLKDIDNFVLNLSGKTTIKQTAAIIKKCRMALGAETGIAHVSCAVGTKNVVLLGGGHFGRFMPYSKLTTAVSYPMECYGCNWICKFDDIKCINNISEDLIVEALEITLLQNSELPRILCGSNENLIKNYNNSLEFELILYQNSNSLENIELKIQNKNYVEAKQELEKLFKKDNTDINVIINLSIVEFLLGNISKAKMYNNIVLKIDPNNEIAKENNKVFG